MVYPYLISWSDFGFENYSILLKTSEKKKLHFSPFDLHRFYLLWHWSSWVPKQWIKIAELCSKRIKLVSWRFIEIVVASSSELLMQNRLEFVFNRCRILPLFGWRECVCKSESLMHWKIGEKKFFSLKKIT